MFVFRSYSPPSKTKEPFSLTIFAASFMLGTTYFLTLGSVTLSPDRTKGIRSPSFAKITISFPSASAYPTSMRELVANNFGYRRTTYSACLRASKFSGGNAGGLTELAHVLNVDSTVEDLIS